MRTLEDIRGRCVITDDGHWLWKGALRPDGRANIWAPDYTHGGEMRVQSGPRAVWHCSTERPVPAGYRCYGVCDEETCCNPACVRCTSETEFGLWQRRAGVYKGKTQRILAIWSKFWRGALSPPTQAPSLATRRPPSGRCGV